MKKKSICLLAVASSMLASCGCGSSAPSAPSLTKIEASNYISMFSVGDTFEFGGTVTAFYSDNATKDVTKDSTFSGYDLNVPGEQTVTVTYQNKTTNYTITVSDYPRLTEITLANMITELDINSEFVFGGTVTAKYSDGSSKNVTSQASFTGYNMTEYGYQIVTVSYSETYHDQTITKTAEYELLVKVKDPIIDDKGWNYLAYQGYFQFGANKLIAKASNSLALDLDHTLTNGTLSSSVSSMTENDRGIVLLDRHPNSEFWEGQGITYYFYFISTAGHLVLGKTANGGWSTIGDEKIKGYSIKKDYNLKISFQINDDKLIQFYAYLNDEFYFACQDYEDTIGSDFGTRCGGVGTEFTYVNSSSKIEFPSRTQVGNYFIGNGNFIKEEYAISSKNPNSIAYINDEFQLGSLEVNMTLNGEPSDNGIIFGLERYGNTVFWESNVSYYFFFIASNGAPYLGRVNNGSWSALEVLQTPLSRYPFKNGDIFNLKIERTNTTIKCYIDNVLYINYTDNCPLLGKEYGIRSGAAPGIKFDTIKANKTGTFEFKKPSHFNAIKGGFMTLNDIAIISQYRESIALANDSTFKEGTLSLDYTQGTSNDAGVIFLSNDNATSYYCFYVLNGRTHLKKVVNNVSSELVIGQFLSAGYGTSIETDMKIIINDKDIYCYLRGILYAHYHDDNILTGNRYGLYSKLPFACFNNIKLNIDKKDHQTNKTLIIGHSYMELWTNYANDLQKFEDIYNIGIGGSNSYHWIEMEENIVEYQPETLIFMIGINDFPGQISPSTIANNVRQTITYLKSHIPTLQNVILVSINRTVTHEVYKDLIAETNIKYRQIANDFDYVKLADVDNAFLKDGNPDPSCFIDGLHPTASAYLTIRDAIYLAAGKK
ncbi:MAG: GDSL-type esterase/lipase family protein [Bacilli bacterium]|nr:GDSL-type esterase/lipase family protein [Bacilli bacterium]